MRTRGFAGDYINNNEGNSSSYGRQMRAQSRQNDSENNSTGVAFFGGASSSGGGGFTGPHYSAAGHSPSHIVQNMQAFFGEGGDVVPGHMYRELEEDSCGAALGSGNGGSTNM